MDELQHGSTMARGPVDLFEIVTLQGLGMCRDYDPPSDPDGGCWTIPDGYQQFFPTMTRVEAWACCARADPGRGFCPYLD